jgi:hypothetical protein
MDIQRKKAKDFNAHLCNKHLLFTHYCFLETPQNKNDFSGSKTLRSVIRLHAYGYFLQEICSLISYHDLPKR